MISATSGYKCVNVTSPDLSGYITGDIFPVRDKRGDGSCNIIRYEDLIFLQEAYAERRYWQAIPSTKEAAAGRVIDGSVVDGCIYTVLSGSNYKLNSTYFGEYYDKSVVLTSPVSVSGSGSRWWEGLTGTPVADSLTVPYFGSCASLDGDKVRRAFYNTGMLSRTVVNPSYNQVLSSFTTSEQISSSSSSTSSTDTHVSYGTIYSYSSGGRYTQWRLVNSASYVNSRQVATYPFATAATLLVYVLWTNSSSSVNYEVVPIACSVSNGTITIPDVVSQSFAQQVCTRHGLPFYASPSYSTTRQYYAVQIHDMALVVDNTFPAEIDSINWSWQPM